MEEFNENYGVFQYSPFMGEWYLRYKCSSFEDALTYLNYIVYSKGIKKNLLKICSINPINLEPLVEKLKEERIITV